MQPIPGRPSRSRHRQTIPGSRSQAARPREYISVQPIPGRPSRSRHRQTIPGSRSQAARPREYISVHPIPGRPSRPRAGSRARPRAQEATPLGVAFIPRRATPTHIRVTRPYAHPGCNPYGVAFIARRDARARAVMEEIGSPSVRSGKVL